MSKNFSIFCLLILLGSCSHSVPKSHGYHRIELPEHQYEQLKFKQYPYFNFDISTNAAIEILPDTTVGEWFNISYPNFNAKLHCTFLPITPSQLNEVSEDSRKFVYRHVTRANAINERLFSNPDYRVYGVLYHLEGNVASPLQFVLTDSISNFFRASLLFNNTPNQDSIAPVLNYIKEDMEQFMESFRWGKDR